MYSTTTYNTTTETNLATANVGRLQQLNPSNEAEIQKYAKEFEGVFLSLLAKEMRKTVGEGGLLSSESTDSLGGLFDLYIGQSLADSQPLGIASLWLDQYKQNAESS